MDNSPSADSLTQSDQPKLIKYRNIALAGDVGTGTTTLGKTLAATLGWQHRNAGAYFREWFRQRGIPLEQTRQVPEEVDRELDQRFKEDLREQNDTVFESHLAGWLAKDMPYTYSILCVADQQVAMERIAAREGWTVPEATQYSMERTESLNQKFLDLYGVSNPYDRSFFDLVIDTSQMSAGAVLDYALQQFLKHQPGGKELAEVLEVSLD